MNDNWPDYESEKTALIDANFSRLHGGRIAFTNGCFDVLHIGHVDLFGQAWDRGYKLYVGVNSDSSVRKLKGAGRPINDEESRCRIVSACKFVTKAFIFDDHRVDRLITKFKPDAWLKGGDYTLETLDQGEVLAARDCGCEIVLIPIEYKISTTEILKKG